MRLMIFVLATKLLVQLCSGQCQSERPNIRAFCANVLASDAGLCDNGQCHGRPGKRGTQGLKGATGTKGDKGDPAPGTDDLERRINELEEKLMKAEKNAGFNFCALGMKSGKIPDGSVTTSSYLNALNVGHFARLGNVALDRVSSGSWCARRVDTSQWIKIDLGKKQQISGLVMQGNPSSDNWVKKFTMSCDNTKVTENGAVKVFTGNSDRNTEVVHMFATVLTCHNITIHPKSWQGRPCLRMEVLRGICSSANRFSFHVESAGADDGWRCTIEINGVDHAKKWRGHCVVIFDVKTHRITVESFDTYGSTEKVTELLNFLKSAPDYSVIAIAIQDAAAPARWNDEIKAYLQGLGAVGTKCGDTTPGYRDSWAFITQKIDPNARRPSWVECQHVRRYNGKAVVHADITTSAFYSSLENSPLV